LLWASRRTTEGGPLILARCLCTFPCTVRQTATAKALEEDIEADHVKPVVGRTFPLEQAAAAHDLVVPPPGQPAPGTVGQVVLVP